MTDAQIRWLVPGRILAAKHYYGTVSGIVLSVVLLTYGFAWTVFAAFSLDAWWFAWTWLVLAGLTFANEVHVLWLNYVSHAHCRGSGRDSCTYGYANLAWKEDLAACTPVIVLLVFLGLLAWVRETYLGFRSRPST